MKRICIIGISGKLGQYMAQHALDRGYEVHGVCRPESVSKLDRFEGRIRVFPGRTDDREVVARALKGCDGVLVVVASWGMQQYGSRTVQAALDLAEPGARFAFSCGWHISKDGLDRYSLKLKLIVALFGPIGRLTRMVDLNDQVEAVHRVFRSNRDWTVVRGSNLEEGESQGLPVWAELAQDPLVASNITRRTDFALFMVHALTDDNLIGKAPAICSRAAPSAQIAVQTEARALT